MLELVRGIEARNLIVNFEKRSQKNSLRESVYASFSARRRLAAPARRHLAEKLDEYWKRHLAGETAFTPMAADARDLLVRSNGDNLPQIL